MFEKCSFYLRPILRCAVPFSRHFAFKFVLRSCLTRFFILSVSYVIVNVFYYPNYIFVPFSCHRSIFFLHSLLTSYLFIDGSKLRDMQIHIFVYNCVKAPRPRGKWIVCVDTFKSNFDFYLLIKKTIIRKTLRKSHLGTLDHCGKTL